MHYHLAIFSVAAYSSAWWPILPNPLVSVCVFLMAFLFVGSRKRLRYTLLALFAGVLSATLWGHSLLSAVLPLAKDKTDYYVVGVVRGIPERNERGSRFLLEVESVSHREPDSQLPREPGNAIQAGAESRVPESMIPPVLKRLQLNWYGPVDLQAGQRWHMTVRLRSPRGFANPGGFDYRLWLLSRGISATGYVRDPDQAQLLEVTRQYSIDRFRKAVRNAILALEMDESSPGSSNIARQLLVALSIGDKRGLSQQVWQKLRLSGTTHLLVISGLHIGMAAALGMLIGSLLGRCLCAAGLNCSRIQVGALFALVFAAIYALLADFSLPTQRALIMLSVFLTSVVVLRVLRPWLAFTWALAIQALLDPLAALSAGFWLSYGAVAAFIWFFSSHSGLAWWSQRLPQLGDHRSSGSRPTDISPTDSRLARLARFRIPFMWLQTLLEAQLLVLLLLSGVLIFFQGSASLLTPLINVLVLPWFSIFIVPLALLGVLTLPASGALASSLWWLAAYQLQYFEQLLDKVSSYAHYGFWSVVTDQYLLVAAAAIIVGLLLLSPRGLGMRAMAYLLIMALLLIAPPQRFPLEVVVLDVGQGLSVVVLTPEGVMVYDTGRKYSESFDIGSAVVAPYLRRRGVKKVDVLIVSHSDTDHSGGAPGLLSQFEAQRIIAGQADRLHLTENNLRPVEQCRDGMQWSWGDVEFEVLHPEGNGESNGKINGQTSGNSSGQQSDNASSCVMTVRLGQQTILLPGDIEADIEGELLQSDKLPDAVTVLVAPHHGSNSSSTEHFLSKVHPAHVVFSAGFRHQFGHPHPTVEERYGNIGTQRWSTAESGAISFVWKNSQILQVGQGRDSLRAYWQESF